MLLAGVSCTNKENGNAQIKFSLTDAPSMEFTAVNLDVQGIEIGVGDSANGKWEALDLLQPRLQPA